MKGSPVTLILLFPAALFPLLSGCGGQEGPARVVVSGKVTFQGQPVADGQIRFVPKPGTAAPVTIEAIKNGTYSTDTSGGVPVGEHLVEIRAYDPNQPPPTGPGEPPRRQLLPDKYNSKTELELKAKAGQRPITRDFELTP